MSLFPGRFKRCLKPDHASVAVILTVAMLSGQLSPSASKTLAAGVWSDAEGLASAVIRGAKSRLGSWPWGVHSSHRGGRQQNVSVADRAAAVDHFRLCPRQLTLYVGEDFNLVPLPLDNHERPVNGVGPAWTTSDQSIATVTSVGEITAVAPGNAMVTASVGKATAHVQVTVLSGSRHRQTDADWDNGHAHDCDAPESASLNHNEAPPGQESVGGDEQAATTENTEVDNSRFSVGGNPSSLASTVGYRVHGRRAASGAVPGSALAPPFPAAGAVLQSSPLLDGNTPDASFSSVAATGPDNAIGSPRFAAKESSRGAAKAKNILGSSDYVFSAPILSLPGRGIAANLAMVYNSQLWSMDSGGTMFFDLNKSWPAPGWNLGYGRLIVNYNSSLTGDGSGSTSANYPGDYLLIQPDGTRIPIIGRWVNPTGFSYSSNDGNFIQLNFQNGKLHYPDGTLVNFDLINNRMLPAVIETRNGDQISISYRTKSQAFPVRVAIDHIIDTLNRSITFNYYGDTNFPADTIAHPAAALASVTVTDQDGVSTRTLVQVDYKAVTFNYSFENSVDATSTPAPRSQIWMLNSITYPQTGRGYTFPDEGGVNGYTAFGMIRRISVRQGMLGSATYGTEVASTLYNYPDPGQNQPDVPQYTTRTESWTGTDFHGNPTTTTGAYNYSLVKAPDLLSETSTITAPDGTVTTSVISTDTTQPASFGNVASTTITGTGGTPVYSSASYSYGFDTGDLNGNGAGVQMTSSQIATDGGPAVTTNYGYGSFGRLMTLTEFGYGSTALRKTKYAYIDDPNYTGSFLDRLLGQVLVIDSATGNTIGETQYTYDAASPGLGTYGTQVSTHDYNHFDTTNLVRGNVTTTTQYVNITTGQTVVNTAQYDIFGNVITATASCCQQKVYSFSTATWFSQPDNETDGPTGGPNLITAFVYNFHTSELTSTTDPNNLMTSYAYDNAWRPSSVTAPTGAVTTTSFDKDGSGNDLLSYTQQVTYLEQDGVTQKILTNKSFFDGAGHTIRSGAGAGTSPSSLDTVATVYDSMGRVSQQTNPYSGNSSGTTSGSISVTTNTFDGLSRVTLVTLPDLNTVTTGFTANTSGPNLGNVTTVTDQVSRQRQSISDGLGRTAKVFEQDPSTGNLTLETDYSYDVLDNLTQVNQGGQIRTFAYDAMSRVTSVTTPEAGTVTYQYNDFSLVTQRNDARGVQTVYGYDGLNRLHTITYPATPPAGVAATTNVMINYNVFTQSAPGNGQPTSITDGGGSESYTYDTLGRLSGKTRTIDGNAYTTGYQYNQVNQLAIITYPSGDRYRTDYDTRGRTLGEDNVDSSGNILTAYASSIAYNPAQQVTGMTLGNTLTEAYTYDGGGQSTRLQLANQNVMKGASTLMNLSYNYQAAAGASGTGTSAHNSGQLMAISSGSTINGQARDESFTYDNVGRLVTAAGYSTWQRRYAYDRYGNRTGSWDATSGGNQLQSITLGTTGGATNNRIATVNGVSYSYDAAGDVTSDGAHSYQYDCEGRIAKVDAGGANEADYFYALNNWRVKKVTGAGGPSPVTTYYVWDSGRVIAEYSTSTSTGNGIRYYHPDRLSTRMITDPTGNVLGTEDVLAFGEDAATDSGVTEKHRFTSYERDSETATDYAINRQYPSSLGRFHQPDLSGGSGFNPQSLNRYAYSVNDPVNLMDPTGLDWFSDWLDPANNNFRTGPDFANWITDQENRAFFGSSYWDLPGNANDREQFEWNYVHYILPKTVAINTETEEETVLYDPADHNAPANGLDLVKLKKCLNDLFKVEYNSLALGTNKQNGGFVGFGNRVGRDPAHGIILINLDTTSMTSKDLTNLYVNNGYHVAPGAAVYGDTGDDPSIGLSPYHPYIASDAKGRFQMSTQIHELGNALNRITGSHLPPAPPTRFGDTDAGVALENCVFSHHIE